MPEEITNIDDVIQEMNQKHAAITQGKFSILTVEKKPGEGQVVQLMSLSDIRNAYANKCVWIKNGGDSKKSNPVDIWMKHPKRREFKGMVFEPGIETPDYYNLYRGLAINPKKGDTQIFHDHVRNIICSGNDALYEWGMDWLADLIQNPGGDRPGTAIVMRGKQGVGKGAFVQPFAKIFGQHHKHLTGQEQFTGRFNSHLKDALLVFVDEAYWAGSKKDMGMLKAFITEDEIYVEQKYHDSFPIKNHIRLIMASNNRWVVPADPEERRMCVLDVSADRRGDRQYFNRYFEWVNGIGPSAILYELQNRKITSDLRTIPRTKALFDQILQSQNSVGKFWHSRLLEGTIGDNDSWPEYLPSRKVYDQYNEFCSDIRERHPVPDNQFTIHLIGLAPGIKRKRKLYDKERHNSLILPDLYVCRESFEGKVDIPIDWEDERST